jgi:hypothetical protein
MRSHKLLVTFVADLERRPRLDGDDAVRADVDSLRWLAEQHRQPARQDDEHLLLDAVGMAPPARARRVTPEPCPRLP